MVTGHQTTEEGKQRLMDAMQKQQDKKGQFSIHLADVGNGCKGHFHAILNCLAVHNLQRNKGRLV